MALLAGAPAAADEPYRAQIETATGEISLRLELADTAELRRRGLQFRRELGPREGMLFVYPDSGRPRIWMKHTLIPLDVLFIDATGRIVAVHEGLRPGQLASVGPGGRAQAVLELKSGVVAETGIAQGDRVRHESFNTGDAG